MVAPVLEQLAGEYAGRIKIAKLNVDENPLTASQFSVKSIPTMLLFMNGKLVETLVGALPKQEIEKIILRVLSS
jgi:thioredoxin 2